MKRAFALALGSIAALVVVQVACDGSVQVGSDASDAGSKSSAGCVGSKCPATTTPAGGSIAPGMAGGGSASEVPSMTMLASASAGADPEECYANCSSECLSDPACVDACDNACDSGSGASGGTSVAPTSSASAGTCVPVTCEGQGVICGTLEDGCGGTINCGKCATSSSGASSGSSTCGDGVCSPGEDCHNCSHDCGPCGGSTTATASGSAGTCVPKTCLSLGADCGGQIPDGCGGFLDCGALCSSGGSASGGSASGGTCGDGVCAAGEDCTSCPADCGTCAGSASAGSATGGCDCCPTTCAQLGITCGVAGDGCGGELTCGAPCDAGVAGGPVPCGSSSCSASEYCFLGEGCSSCADMVETNGPDGGVTLTPCCACAFLPASCPEDSPCECPTPGGYFGVPGEVFSGTDAGSSFPDHQVSCYGS